MSDLTHPKWKYYFPCGQWLAKDEGDGAICRDLIGSKDPLAMRKCEFLQMHQLAMQLCFLLYLFFNNVLVKLGS